MICTPPHTLLTRYGKSENIIHNKTAIKIITDSKENRSSEVLNDQDPPGSDTMSYAPHTTVKSVTVNDRALDYNKISVMI